MWFILKEEERKERDSDRETERDQCIWIPSELMNYSKSLANVILMIKMLTEETNQQQHVYHKLMLHMYNCTKTVIST